MDPSRCCEFRLAPTSGGGFRLESERGAEYVIGPPDGGRRTVDAGDRLWVLRSSSSRPGFVLETATTPGREIARSDRGPAGGAGVFLEDGRCFWIVPRIGAHRRYELRGWEVEGAYWIAEPHGAEWFLSATPAGEWLRADEVVLLFAAEIIAERDDVAAEPCSPRDRTEPGMNHGT